MPDPDEVVVRDHDRLLDAGGFQLLRVRLAPLPGSADEKITEGLDGLPARVEEYVGLGARFAKWRAVITISDNLPSRHCIHTNAHALARYAKICQEGGLTPIVEPEVLMDGGHDIDRCEQVTTLTLNTVFDELYTQQVALEGMILKPNMVISGSEFEDQADAEEVARRTVECMNRCVPAAVPGIMFLSGGQSEEAATTHLNIMNAKFTPVPWKLSYSYGRALQQSCLKTWLGNAGNASAARTNRGKACRRSPRVLYINPLAASMRGFPATGCNPRPAHAR